MPQKGFQGTLFDITSQTEQGVSEELRNAANSLSKGKTPGIDGLPVEFYQEYWDIYGEELTTLANENFFDTKNQMS